MEGDPVTADLRQLIGGLRACVESQLSMEESVLFPMLLRLQEQTLITPCRAGMIRGRVSQAERDLARYPRRGAPPARCGARACR